MKLFANTPLGVIAKTPRKSGTIANSNVKVDYSAREKEENRPSAHI